MTTTAMAQGNHLAGETSPYLLQHAHNPVNWWPWCDQALTLAREFDKPILLSIGYSACHWCHVMAHESFEDYATAEVMNELFINIKVDREERPDLDKIYQSAFQMMNQRAGGWPLTVFLTPDTHTPIFAGTYFPPQPRYNMPAFTDVLRQVAAYYREHRHEVMGQHQAFVEAFASTQPQASQVAMDASVLTTAYQQLQQYFDHRFGGFGKAPKFPHPTNLTFLLQHVQATRQDTDNSLAMLDTTLTRMAEGGIFDQLGGGFFRYSVDDHWLIPHFEKMLYDNGLLLHVYSQAYARTHNPLYREISMLTAEWVMREMQSPTGGYFASQDADTDGEEGKFYLWEPEELRRLLPDAEYRAFSYRYGLEQSANFEHRWHLFRSSSLEEVSRRLSQPMTQVTELLEQARQKCFAHRAARYSLGRDDKILTSWNGLMIRGMATAGRYLQQPDYIESAQRAVDFIRTNMFVDGRLLATAKDGKAHLMAYLDDYAFVLEGLLELLQTNWRSQDLMWAIQLANALLNYFEDSQTGGFFFTAHDHEKLLHRSKSMSDEATPAGNAVTAKSLLCLGYLLGNQRYLLAAERTLRCAWNDMQHTAFAHGVMLETLMDYLQPRPILIVRGQPEALRIWVQAIRREQDDLLCFAIPTEVTDLPETLQYKTADAHDTIAYLCRGTQCHPPQRDLTALLELLNTEEVNAP